MKTAHRTSLSLLTLLPLLLIAGCSEEPVGPQVGETALLDVSPAGGSVEVDPDLTVRITFSHPLMSEMEAYAVLHRGEVTGPEVAGSWTLSEDRTVLEFTPAVPLAPGTRYTLHLGGGLMDASGRGVDMQRHGPHLGGEWAGAHMMGGGGGAGHGAGHMGDGWRHANGSYGMVFSFDTAP